MVIKRKLKYYLGLRYALDLFVSAVLLTDLGIQQLQTITIKRKNLRIQKILLILLFRRVIVRLLSRLLVLSLPNASRLIRIRDASLSPLSVSFIPPKVPRLWFPNELVSSIPIEKSMSRASKQEKFKKLLEARRTGTIGSESSDNDDGGAIYDEVDEETFRKHKRDQLLQDDFIVDDTGEGYAENGVDEWDDSTRPNYSSDAEAPTRKSKSEKTKKVLSQVTATASINNYFRPVTAAPKEQTVAESEATIDDILDDFQGPQSAKNNTFNTTSVRKKTSAARNFAFSTSSRKAKKPKLPELAPPDTLYDDLNDSNMDIDVPTSDGKVNGIEKTQSCPVSSHAEQQKPESDAESDDDIVVRRRPMAAAVPSTIPAVKASELVSRSQNSLPPTEKVKSSSVLDENSMKMFWLDYAEVDNSLLLFGKVLTKEGECVSGVIQVNGLERELFALLRKFKVVDGQETDQPVNIRDVHDEIAPILIDSYGLDRLRAKPETLKYAFELPGVPKETEYLKILLPFKTTKNRNLIMPSEIEGVSFLRIFGTNVNIFESFVLQRNVMGPCWLEIKNADFDVIKNASHCQVEVAVPSAACVTPITNTPLVPPTLTITVLSVQTVMNARQNKQEVACISIATYKDLPQDVPIDANTQPDDMVTLVRPVGPSGFPPGLTQAAKKQNLNFRALPNEASMLSCFAALIKTVDPDVFVGHRLENISLDVLVHRMHDLKIPTWSAIGKRNRKAWPDKFGKSNGFNNNLLIREVFQGRLLCDIANELGQSLTPKCQSWDLPEMSQVVCQKPLSLTEINFSNPRYAEDANFFLMPLKQNLNEVLVMAQISFAIQILTLSKQLTNLAGNAWSHTLSGTRAGRNEYILLHEFKRNNYIVPDKEDRYHKNANHQQEARLEANEDDATTITSNKKPKFQGGLVFEPEKGLHKNYILVMDFNSLYPSIIQEFNICFTTVNRDAYNTTHDEERDMPSIPERDSEPGVLPRLLNTLVSRRREVKKLLKDPRISVTERAQYDIKQQALKLTANSMYGCLGYVNSRFYAKPLAMLVTNKGREILMDTRQLAESIGLRVVYGDTDSVMIDTGALSFQEAIKIGDDFKLQVNEKYKLLEIDTDNVFKRLLLHAKKKYAAMNATIDKKTGKEVSTLEVKGLDMRRREYCPLSKEISTYVLEELLSDKDPEEAVSNVYEYLESMGTKFKENSFPVDKFTINTRLSKDPVNYPNGKTMPPVQVALRLRNQGKVIKAGSVITFVITAPSEGDKSSVAERARAIQEILSIKDLFVPDCEYYLEKQIYAPVERLLSRIEGIDLIRVASSLGIDSKKYVMRLRSSDNVDVDIAPLESKTSDIERFRSSSYLVLKCTCGHQFRFGGILSSKDYKLTFNGVVCLKCEATFTILQLTAQLEVEIRRHLALYYAGWLVCDDAACGIKTRQISVYGKRCIGASGKAHGCKGVMRYKYSDKALYNQLLYFDAIFDVEKAKKRLLRPIHADLSVDPLSEGQVNALAEQNRGLFDTCRGVVGRYLQDCGRRYVNIKAIFDFML